MLFQKPHGSFFLPGVIVHKIQGERHDVKACIDSGIGDVQPWKCFCVGVVKHFCNDTRLTRCEPYRILMVKIRRIFTELYIEQGAVNVHFQIGMSGKIGVFPAVIVGSGIDIRMADGV